MVWYAKVGHTLNNNIITFIQLHEVIGMAITGYRWTLRDQCAVTGCT